MLSPYAIRASLTAFAIDIALDEPLPTGTKHLVNDTRKLAKGDVFCALVGHQQDGRDYISQAIDARAGLVIAQCQYRHQHGNLSWQTVSRSSTTGEQSDKIAIIEFYQLDHHLFAFANHYYQQPQAHLSMIGITGTNGKTSICQLIARLLEHNGKQAAVIGTNGNGRLDALTTTLNTTPAATYLHQLLAEYIDQGISHVAMEVSSHALSQGRVSAELFAIAVYSNLSHEHLDYHKTMKNYAAAKRQIFTGHKHQMAILNGDDKYSQLWLTDWPQEQDYLVYGRSVAIKHHAKYLYASNIVHHSHGVSFTLQMMDASIEVKSSLMGDFNIDNLLAAIAVLYVQGISLTDIVAAVSSLSPVIGRMESFTALNKATAIVDYAHTPDALHNALLACRQHCSGDLWVVFGCGGERDVDKRPVMGEIAEKYAQHIVLTNDNPRSETPRTIVNNILSGCHQPDKVTVILERQQAVLFALKQAKANDIVLLAGKGHEVYILQGDKKLKYNERAVVGKFYQNEVVL